MMEKRRVFISYSSKDAGIAAIVESRLEKAGLSVWRDKTRLEIDWSFEIAHELAASDLLCLLWSQHSAQSKWVQHEWLTARAVEKTIVVYQIADAPPLPGPLENLHAVIAVDIDTDCRELIQRLTKVNRKKRYTYEPLPQRCNLPFRPNGRFTGRLDDLRDLYVKLIGNLKKTGINQVGLIGMSGVGKTQLAIEFGYRFSFAFDGVYWIQADEAQGLRNRFVQLARDQLHLKVTRDDNQDASAHQHIQALQQYLHEHTNTLLIVDNVKDPELLNDDSYLFGVSPLTLGCDLLFTTRKHFDLPEVVPHSVDILSMDASFNLLSSYRKPASKAEKESAYDVVNAVGHLPLAIVLAGALLKAHESATPFLDYLTELRQSKLDTIDLVQISRQSLATRHETVIRKTLEDHWQMLTDERARTLFELAGQFSEAEIIPKARLGLLAGIEVSRSRLNQPLAQAFHRLEQVCLVDESKQQTGAVRMHPLIREFANALVPSDQTSQYRHRAATRIKKALFNYPRLTHELNTRGIDQVIGDLQIALDWFDSSQNDIEPTQRLNRVLRLSRRQLLTNPEQLPSQLFGRTALPLEPDLENLLQQVSSCADTPWLRPLDKQLASPADRLASTLEGHTIGVTSVALMPDYRYIVSGALDRTIRIWDITAGQEKLCLKGHQSFVRTVAVNKTGNRLVSGDEDGVLKTWLLRDDLTEATLLYSIQGHEGPVRKVTLSDDDNFFVSAGDDQLAKVWTLTQGRARFTLRGHKGAVTDVVVTPDCRKVVTSSWDRTIRIWDSHNGKRLKTIDEHTGPIIAIALAPDGNTLLAASDEEVETEVWYA